jgi:hydroxymethylglutaryl-CoA lyase
LRARLKDISPRLGFQAFPGVDTSVKVELIDRLTAAGLPAIEASSFVRPDLVPGLADAAEVFGRVDRSTGASFECCVGNLRGLRRAADAGADAAWFLLSVDEGFAANNIGRSREDSLAELARMREQADALRVRLGTYLIFTWGGPDGPARTPEDVAPLFERLVDIGVTDWILADSLGYASPAQIEPMIRAALEHVAPRQITVQVHDSRGMGLANIVALTGLGIENIDVALGGSGGHPAMPGARGGGVCTEDAVQMLHLLGVETGVDLDALVTTANWLADEVGVPCDGFVRQSGPVPTAPSLDHASSFRWQP